MSRMKTCRSRPGKPPKAESDPIARPRENRHGRRFAEAFVILQEARQQADYALDVAAYRKSDVLHYIASAELAISRFEQADVNAKRGFAAHVLFRQRAP